MWNLESLGLDYIVERFESLREDLPRIEWNWQGLVRQCHQCLTEFSLEFEQFEKKVEALFVIKWQDLGQGRTPMDYKWQSHVGYSAERLWQSVELDRGTVCAMFERKGYVRFKSTGLLTQQDKKELLGLLPQNKRSYFGIFK